jgi:hypothetical protein
MSQKDLINQLKQLHDELPDQTLEEGQHKHLIGDLLENLESQDIGNENFDQFSDLTESVKLLLIKYEDNHPALAGILRSLSNTLAGMGI